jgi:hypothetical protein
MRLLKDPKKYTFEAFPDSEVADFAECVVLKNVADELFR